MTLTLEMLNMFHFFSCRRRIVTAAFPGVPARVPQTPNPCVTMVTHTISDRTKEFVYSVIYKFLAWKCACEVHFILNVMNDYSAPNK